MTHLIVKLGYNKLHVIAQSQVNNCFELTKTDYDMHRNYTFCYDYERNSEEEMGQLEPNSEGGLNFMSQEKFQKEQGCSELALAME